MAGYSHVADFMAAHGEFAIVRRFRSLNLQNLLYLQAEITHLEEQLLELAERDSRHPGRPFHSKDWWSLAQDREDEDHEQWGKMLELREKLNAFNDAVLKQVQIFRLDEPTKYHLNFLRSWFVRDRMGAFPLLGLDRTAWDEVHEKDLVALRAQNSSDRFSTWFSETLVPRYHHLIGEKTKDAESAHPGIYIYDDQYLATILYSICTVVASVLPICSVVVLYVVQSNDVRLGLTVVFCACFALALVLLTRARNVEVFAATAAFAAVNVVFLTNNIQCQG